MTATEIIWRVKKWFSPRRSVLDANRAENSVRSQTRTPHYEQKAELFCCAMQLLDDVGGAEQVVRQTLAESGKSVSPPDETWLLRQVVGLSVQRLKALSIVPVLPPIPEAARNPDGPVGDSIETPPIEPRANHEQQRRDRLSRALLRLPVEMRVTLVLSSMQRRPLSEIALLLGASERTCRFWLSHGRKQLRRALQRDLGQGTESSNALRVLVSPEATHDVRGNKKAIARA